ncbi:hypothetical protein [Frateuria sp. Soil773]|nr:hypothetical protein [Frateuria sp. Soil773]
MLFALATLDAQLLQQMPVIHADSLVPTEGGMMADEASHRQSHGINHRK